MRSEGRIFVIDVDEIDWVSVERRQIFIYATDRKYLANYTLDELQSRLNSGLFFRAHRSAMVNLTKIKEIILWFAGIYRVKLTIGAEVD